MHQIRMEQHLKLAEFKTPPLVEVVAGIQFAKLEALSAAKIGDFWKLLPSEFVDTQDQPPLPPIAERFDKPTKAHSLQLLQQPATPRIWFHNVEKTKIVQIQNDRLIFNWRKANDQEIYPRYHEIKNSFFKIYEAFSAFVKQNIGMDISEKICELTYINHIKANEHFHAHKNIDIILSFLPPMSLGFEGSSLEEARFNITYRLPERAGRPIGRLRLNLEPRVELPSGDPLYVLEIGVRGHVWEGGIGGLNEFFDLAHGEIVPAFVKVTSDKMHSIWGKKDVGQS